MRRFNANLVPVPTAAGTILITLTPIEYGGPVPPIYCRTPAELQSALADLDFPEAKRLEITQTLAHQEMCFEPGIPVRDEVLERFGWKANS